MHEMQPIATDVRGVCPSVCLSVRRISSASLCKKGQADQDAVWGEHSWGPLCYVGVLIPHRGKGESGPNVPQSVKW